MAGKRQRNRDYLGRFAVENGPKLKPPSSMPEYTKPIIALYQEGRIVEDATNENLSTLLLAYNKFQAARVDGSIVPQEGLADLEHLNIMDAVENRLRLEGVIPQEEIPSYPDLKTIKGLDWQQDYDDYLFGIEDLYQSYESDSQVSQESLEYYRERAKAIAANPFGRHVLKGDLARFRQLNMEAMAVVLVEILSQ